MPDSKKAIRLNMPVNCRIFDRFYCYFLLIDLQQNPNGDILRYLVVISDDEKDVGLSTCSTVDILEANTEYSAQFKACTVQGCALSSAKVFCPECCCKPYISSFFVEKHINYFSSH